MNKKTARIIAIILGVIVGFLAFSGWFVFIRYMKEGMIFQMATVLQMFILTLTSVALFLNCSLWIIFVGLVFWFLCPFVSLSLIYRFGAGIGHNLSYIVPLVYTTILGWSVAKNNKYKLNITLICSIAAVFILMLLARISLVIFYQPKP